MPRFLLILAALAATAAAAETPSAPATPHTYYVDATRGDDAQGGLAPEAAWRSLARVNAAALRPGDTVRFRRGGVWRGQIVAQSGDATGLVTYTAYGEGDKPLLLGSVAADSPADWQPLGGDVWATAPARFEPGEVLADLRSARWTLHREGGAEAAVSAPVPDEAGRPTYRLDCKAAGKAANHIQWSVAGLKVEAGQIVALSFRARATQPFRMGRIVLMQAASPWTGYGRTISAAPAIGTEWAEHTVLLQVKTTAADGRATFFLGDTLPAGATLFFQPGTVRAVRGQPAAPLDVDVGNIIFDHGKATGFKKWSPENLKDDGDYYYDPSAWQVRLKSAGNPAGRWKSIELALKRHIIDEGGKAYVTYDGLALAYGAAHGIGGGTTHHITARNCDVYFIGGGHQLTRPDGKPVRFGNGIEFWAGARDNLVEDCRLWEIYDAALTNQGKGTNVQENITYRRNVIWNSEYSFEYWNRDEGSRTRNIRFEHNTCVDAGRGWGHRQRPDKNGRHLMFYYNSAATEGVVVRYNIFAGATESLLRLHGRDWTAALAMDCNVWFQPEGPLMVWGTETIAPADFAAYQKARGQDAHSVVADPKFVAPEKNDYRVAPDSPARKLLDGGQPAGALR